jgi:hypothetical protein
MMRSGSNWYGGGAGGNLTGTGEMTDGSATLTGTGTAFTTELAPWDRITVAGISMVVGSIASDTSLTTTVASSYDLGPLATLTVSQSNLPYYGLKILIPVATEYETDGDLNVTQLNYEIVFEIRSDAWPA